MSRRADAILQTDDASLLDLVDHVLNQGIVVTGDVVLGVANVDLVYVRLSALLCAADRLWPTEGGGRPRRAGRRRARRAP